MKPTGSFLLISDVEMNILASSLRLRAARGIWDGRTDAAGRAYTLACRKYQRRSGSIVMFTRDTGMHSSGWMKNPDYERCYHLSLSFRDPMTGLSRPHDWELARRWVSAFYTPDQVRLLWTESPKSEDGIELGVWHHRLFCNEHWQPILPRKEVYSMDFTEQGWKSASEVFETTGRVVESVVDPS